LLEIKPRGCTLKEEPESKIINATTGTVFTRSDLCVERGPHLGLHPAATKMAVAAVKEFLRSRFKLAKAMNDLSSS
jgi:hypothetical protein